MVRYDIVFSFHDDVPDTFSEMLAAIREHLDSYGFKRRNMYHYCGGEDSNAVIAVLAIQELTSKLYPSLPSIVRSIKLLRVEEESDLTILM